MCIGGGPGATAEAVGLTRARPASRPPVRVIAVNDAYLLAPWAEICYFADYNWWQWQEKGIRRPGFTAEEVRERFARFAGQKVTIENTGGMVRDPDVFMLHNYGNDGLSEKPNGLHTGSNGGHQAVNIAVLAGARKILLVGYDMRFPGGRSHWHNGHPYKVPEQRYGEYARRFKTMLPQLERLGVEVVNCTPGSAIACFRFGNLAEELA